MIMIHHSSKTMIIFSVFMISYVAKKKEILKNCASINFVVNIQVKLAVLKFMCRN